MNSELIRLKEVSDILGLKTCTLRKMIKRNELKAVLIGGNYYIRPNDYYEFIYNVECKKYGVKPEDMKKIVKKEKEEYDKELFKYVGIDKLDKNSQEFIIKTLYYIKNN